MTASYTKLRDGSWGIRIVGVKVTTGQKVTVTKKSGQAKEETVGKVLWSGEGVTLATVASGEDAPSAPASNTSNRGDSRRCCVCGVTEQRDHRGYPVGGVKILRSGECGDCYEERKMGY